MKKRFLYTFLISLAGSLVSSSAKTYVSTNAYKWVDDSIVQGPFKAYAPSDFEIVSTYSAQPGYFMPVDKFCCHF